MGFTSREEYSKLPSTGGVGCSGRAPLPGAGGAGAAVDPEGFANVPGNRVRSIDYSTWVVSVSVLRAGGYSCGTKARTWINSQLRSTIRAPAREE